jgi:hypothetical protein
VHPCLPAVGPDPDHDQQAQLVLLQADVDVDAVGPQVAVVHTDRSRSEKLRCSSFHVSVSLVIIDPDSPTELPRNCPSAGTKSPLDSPCRYTNGRTSAIFGVLRHHGGRIADENLIRSPLSGSIRRSLTRGAVTSTAPTLVRICRG